MTEEVSMQQIEQETGSRKVNGAEVGGDLTAASVTNAVTDSPARSARDHNPSSVRNQSPAESSGEAQGTRHDWKTLYEKIPAKRPKSIEGWVRGAKARLDNVPLTEIMSDPDAHDGWGEIDIALLAQQGYGVPAKETILSGKAQDSYERCAEIEKQFGIKRSDVEHELAEDYSFLRWEGDKEVRGILWQALVDKEVECRAAHESGIQEGLEQAAKANCLYCRGEVKSISPVAKGRDDFTRYVHRYVDYPQTIARCHSGDIWAAIRSALKEREKK